MTHLESDEDYDFEIKKVNRNGYTSSRGIFIDEDDLSEDEYEAIERLVENPEIEELERKRLLSQESTFSSAQYVPHLPSSSSLILKETTTDKKKEPLNEKTVNFLWAVCKPFFFVIYMTCWIVYEPLIRTLTFITMIVSNVLVDPILYLWSILPHQTPTSPEFKKKLTQWCTYLILTIVGITTAQKYYPTDSEGWTVRFRELTDFSRSTIPVTTDLSDIHHQLQLIHKKLNENNMRWHGLEDGKHKIWSVLDQTKQNLQQLTKEDKEYQKRLNQQLKENQDQIAQVSRDQQVYQTQLVKSLKDQGDRLTKALQDQQTQWAKSLQDQHHHLSQRLQAQQNQLDQFQAKSNLEIQNWIKDHLPQLIFVQTDKTGKKLDLPPQLYEYFQSPAFLEEFLKKNKEAMDKYLAGEMKSFFETQQKQGALISRDDFIHYMTHDLTHKVKKSDLGSYEAENLQDLMSTVIQQYHQDVLNMADYALASRGGRIIYTKTSRTYEPRLDFFAQIKSSFGLKIQTYPPDLMLLPQTLPGECWRMEGQEGSVGIMLSEAIYIQSISIDHPSPQLLQHEIKNAPQDMEFYGLKDLGSSESSVFLGRAQYNASNTAGVQTFNLDLHPTESFRAVLVKIKSNWGNTDYTDIYRVRVHGIPSHST